MLKVNLKKFMKSWGNRLQMFIKKLKTIKYLKKKLKTIEDIHLYLFNNNSLYNKWFTKKKSFVGVTITTTVLTITLFFNTLFSLLIYLNIENKILTKLNDCANQNDNMSCICSFLLFFLDDNLFTIFLTGFGFIVFFLLTIYLIHSKNLEHRVSLLFSSNLRSIGELNLFFVNYFKSKSFTDINNLSNKTIPLNNSINISLYQQNILNNYVVNFEELDKKLVGKNLIIGEAGKGKTTLVKKICFNWAESKFFNQFQLLLYMDLASWDNEMTFMQNLFKKYLNIDNIKKYNLEEEYNLLLSNNDTILLIIDGYDEKESKNVEFFNKIEKFNNVLYLSRPYFINKSKFDEDKIFYISELHYEQSIEFIKLILNKNEQASLISFIEKNYNILEFIKTPIMIDILCKLWIQDSTKIQDKYITKTKLYLLVVDQLLFEYSEIKNYNNFQYKEKEIFDFLSEIAYKSFTQNILINKTVIEDYKLKLFQEVILKLGLLNSSMSNMNSYLNSYNFVHRTFQEYFTALYLSTQNDEEIKSFIKENKHNPTYDNVFVFLSGLIKNKKLLLTELYSKNIDIIGYRILNLWLECANEVSSNEIMNFSNVLKDFQVLLKYTIQNDVGYEKILQKLKSKDILLKLIKFKDITIQLICIESLVNLYYDEIINEFKLIIEDYSEKIKKILLEMKILSMNKYNFNLTYTIRENQVNYYDLIKYGLTEAEIIKGYKLLLDNKIYPCILGSCKINIPIFTESQNEDFENESINKLIMLTTQSNIIEVLFFIKDNIYKNFSSNDFKELFHLFINIIDKPIIDDEITKLDIAIRFYEVNIREKVLTTYISKTISTLINDSLFSSKDIMYKLEKLAFCSDKDPLINKLLYDFISNENIEMSKKIDISKGLYLHGERNKNIIYSLLNGIFHSNNLWNSSIDKIWFNEIIFLLENGEIDRDINLLKAGTIFYHGKDKKSMKIDILIEYINNYNLLDNEFVNINLLINAFILDMKSLFFKENKLLVYDNENRLHEIKCDIDEEVLISMINNELSSKVSLK